MRVVPVTPGASGGELREGPAADRQVLDRRRIDREGSLGGIRLDERRLPLDLDDFLELAQLQHERRHRHPIAGADGHAAARRRLETGEHDLERVGVGREVGEDVVPLRVRR